ncbi:MAG: hypothetical protein D6830_06250 [Ignavibacteria bacterium]|nr:MAG: hypothetical protein D6830_06250 [Ignavibacteria bacterium]
MSLSLVNAGINITSEKLQLSEVSFKEGKFVLENIDEEYFSEIIDFDGKEAKAINILQAAFDEITLRNSVKAENISFTLPPNKFKSFEIPYEVSLSPNDLLKHIRWEFEKLFPREDEKAYLIREIKVSGSNMRTEPTTLVLAIRKKYVEMLHKFALRNKLRLKFVDHAHLASSNIFRGMKKGEETVEISLYSGDKSFSLMVINNNAPIYFKNYKIDQAVELIEKLQLGMKAIERIGIPLPEDKKGYIAGDNITDTLLEQIKSELGITFYKLNPFSVIYTDPDLEVKEIFNRKYNSFAASTGISFRLG